MVFNMESSFPDCLTSQFSALLTPPKGVPKSYTANVAPPVFVDDLATNRPYSLAKLPNCQQYQVVRDMHYIIVNAQTNHYTGEGG